MSSNESNTLTPLIKAKKIIAIYPTVLVCLGFICTLVYNIIESSELKYMDYIMILYIIFLFLLIIFSSISRKLLCKVFRKNAKILINNKGKGCILCLVSFIYFGHTVNFYHKVMNIVLVVMGTILLSLDFLIVGDWEKTNDEHISDGNYNTDKRDSNVNPAKAPNENISQLDKSDDDPGQNNPYAIPQDF